jgi:hypothetical protein
MSISSLSALANVFKAKWRTHIVEARTNEQGQLQAYMGNTTTYASITEQVDEWARLLSVLGDKPRVSASVSKPLLQANMQCFSALNSALDFAGNNVEWICTQKHFAVNLTIAGFLVREITSEQGRETAAIVTAAGARLEKDLSFLQQGSSYAQNLIGNKEKIDTQIETVSEANETVTEKLSELEKSTTKAQEHIEKLNKDVVQLASASNESIEESVTSFNTTLKEAKDTLAEAAVLKAQAEALVKTATTANELAANKFSTAENDLTEATKKQIATNDRLNKALQSAQMEGLAGSFTKRAEEAELMIKTEQDRFESALKYLAIIAGATLLYGIFLGFPKTTDEFFFRLIHTLSLATPGIWIAWTATRKLAALNRILSDYQYKSASALAYESYRQAVAAAGDDALEKQLLAFAIRSFGENPTRYYDSAQNDPSSPADSWLSKLGSLGKSGSDKPATPV